jgi:hypothetical protein
MPRAIPSLVLAAALAVAAGGPSCTKPSVDPRTRHVLVKHRLAPGAITKASPQKEFRCVAYTVEVTNNGYEKIEFDRGSFFLQVEGKTRPSAARSSCETAGAVPPAKLDDGKSWKAVVAFEQPVFTLDARVLLKPAAVKDGLLGNATAPKIEYRISSGN